MVQAFIVVSRSSMLVHPVLKKKLQVNNSASASDKKCCPLKAPFRVGNNAKSDGARSGDSLGCSKTSHLIFFKSSPITLVLCGCAISCKRMMPCCNKPSRLTYVLCRHNVSTIHHDQQTMYFRGRHFLRTKIGLHYVKLVIEIINYS